MPAAKAHQNSVQFGVPVQFNVEENSQIDSDVVEAFVDQFMAEALNDMHIPGAVAIVAKDGELIFNGGYGDADIAQNRPLTPQTYLRVASITKLFTFAALLQLEEQGHFELTDDVNQYLDSPLAMQADGKAITFVNLLTHTEGFEDRTVGIVARSENDIQPLQLFFAETVPNQIQPAGKMITYGNYGAVLAGVLIENISDMSFETYLRENLFLPSQMMHSTTTQPFSSEILDNAAAEYIYENMTFEPVKLVYPNVVPGGGMTATGEDMGNFMLMLLNGGKSGENRVLSEETVRSIFSRQFAPHPDLPGTTYGLMEGFENGVRTVRRDGYGLESRSRLLFVPDEGVGIFLYYNVGENELRDAFFEQFFDRFYPDTSQPDLPDQNTGQQISNITGQYAAVQTDQTTYGKLQILFAGLIDVSRTGEDSIQLNPTNFDAYSGIGIPSQWREIDSGLFERTDAPEGRIAFLQDDTGTYLFAGTGFLGAYKKVRWFETMHMQGILAGIVMITLLAAVICGGNVLLRTIRSDAQNSWLLTSIWFTTFVFGVVGLILAFAMFYGVFLQGGMMAGLPAYAFGANMSVDIAGRLMWGIVIVGGLLLVLIIASWRKRVDFGSLRSTMFLSSMAGVSLIYIWLIHYWNLLGNRY